MPRIGIVCPVDGAQISDEECLKCRAGSKPREGLPHWCEFPYEIVNGILAPHDRSTAFISATMLSGCPRAVRLGASIPYHTSIESLYFGYRGQIVHQMLENQPMPGCVYEYRFQCNIPGIPVPISGQIDCLDLVRNFIRDGKSKNPWGMPKEVPEAYTLQLNTYKYLVKHGWPQKAFTVLVPGEASPRIYEPGTPANIDIVGMELHMINMENVKTMACPILPEQDVVDYIREKATLLTQVEFPWIPDGLNPLDAKHCVNYCPGPVRDRCEELMLQGK